MTVENKIDDQRGDSFAASPGSATTDIVKDIAEACAKLRACGEVPDTVRVNPALLMEEMLPKFLARCDELGITVQWEKAKSPNAGDQRLAGENLKPQD